MMARRTALCLALALAASPLPAALVLELSNEPASTAGFWKMNNPNSTFVQDLTTSINYGNHTGYVTFEPGKTDNNKNIAALPNGFTKKAWISSSTLNGSVMAGTWNVKVQVRNRYLDTALGKAWVRIWRGSSANGNGAIAVSPWTADNDTLSLGPSMVTLLSISVDVPSSGITLNNEYVFLELAWQMVTTSISPEAGVQLLVGEGPAESLTLAEWANATSTPSPSPTPSITPTATPGFSSPTPSVTPNIVVSLPGGPPVLDRNLFRPSQGPLGLYFETTAAGDAQLDIYDSRGRFVRSMKLGYLPAGAQWAAWDGKTDSGAEAASDLYFLRVKAPGLSVILKTYLLR